MSRSKMLTDGDVRRETAARDDGSTHWDGCWESHHDCAIVMLAEARAEAALFKAERRALVEAGVRAGMEWAGAGKGRPTGTTISLPPDIAPRVLAEFEKEKP